MIVSELKAREHLDLEKLEASSAIQSKLQGSNNSVLNDFLMTHATQYNH